MLFQFVTGTETLLTFIANVRLHTTNHSKTDMRHQVTSCLERLSTERTVIRSSDAMYTTFVQLQGATLAETFVTEWTVVSFFSSMQSHVTLEISRLHERLQTYSTFIWFTVAVYAKFVPLEVTALVETFVTKWTVVWFLSGVDSHVAIQQTRRNKCLLTHFTSVWFLSTVNSAVTPVQNVYRKPNTKMLSLQNEFVCVSFLTLLITLYSSAGYHIVLALLVRFSRGSSHISQEDLRLFD